MVQKTVRKTQVWSGIKERRSLLADWLNTVLSFCGHPALQRVLRGLPAFLLAAVLSHGMVTGELCPFAPAFLCASQMKEKHRFAAAAGCISGTLLMLDGAGLLVCVMMTVVLEGLRCFKIRPNALLCLVTAGLLQLALPLLWAESLYDLLLAFFASVAVLLLSPLFAEGLSVNLSKRKALCPEELVGFLLLAASALSGLRSLRLFGVSPVLAGLLFCCVTVGFFGGAGKGALCGVICGLLPAVTLPSDPTLLPVFPLLGLLCGLPVTKRRLWVLPAAFAAALLAVAFDSTLLMLSHGIELAAALIAFFLLDARGGDAISRALNRDCVPYPLPDAVRDTADRLRGFGGLYRRMSHAGGELAGQYAALGQALCTVAGELEQPPEMRIDLAQSIREVLEKAGVVTETVAVEQRKGRISAKVTVLCRAKDGLCARELPRLVSRALDRPMRLIPAGLCPENGGCCLCFSEEAPIRCAVGAASRAIRGENGDTFTSLELPEDRLLLALSDGMGHGEGANAESRAAMELIETYLSAGFATEDALLAVNDALLCTAAAERFATMDVAILDKHTGCMDVLKVGACPSYIRRGKELIALHGESLPLGILKKVKPSVTHISLQDGDALFLLTDGVCDALSGDETALQKHLMTLPLRDPEHTAQTLLAAVSASGTVKDDMTAAVLRVSVNRKVLRL